MLEQIRDAWGFRKKTPRLRNRWREKVGVPALNMVVTGAMPCQSCDAMGIIRDDARPRCDECDVEDRQLKAETPPTE